MKKKTAILISVIFIVTLWTGTTFAEGSTSTDTTTTAAETTATSTAVVTSATTTDSNVIITPDNILYTVKRLVESIQVALTFSPEGKAELLVTLADKRLAEADIMSEKNKQELLEQVMKAYIKTMLTANEKLEEAAQAGKDVTKVLDYIRIVELTADKMVIKAIINLPSESAEALKAQITDQVKSTLAVQAFAIAKTDFKDANSSVKAANEELRMAEKSGDEASIKAAKEKLVLALQTKADAEKLKDEVETYKNDIIRDIKNEDKEDRDDEDKLKQKEQLQRKIVHLEEIIAKQQVKRAEQIEKHKNQPGNASKMIEENTIKQIEKRNAKVEALKEQLGASQPDSTTEQALIVTSEKVTYDTAITADPEVKDDDEEDKVKNENKGAKGLGKKEK